MSYRKTRVENTILNILNLNIKEIIALNTELTKSMISITKVSMSNDLKIANCYFSKSLFSTLDSDIILNELNNIKHIFRKLINQKLRLKYSPEIKFFYDSSAEELENLNMLLKKIKNKEKILT